VFNFIKTPLHIAADYDHHCVFVYLVNQKAEINEKNTNDLTPLQTLSL